MGLQEKRWVKQGQDETVPKYQSLIADLAGVVLPIEVDWPSFANDLSALENFEYQGCVRILDAFRDICRDQLGKDCVKESLKRIVMKNVPDPAQKKVEVTDGNVVIHAAWAKGSNGVFTDDDIRLVIEKAL